MIADTDIINWPSPATVQTTTATTVAVGTLVDGETVSWCWHLAMRALEDYDRDNGGHIKVVAHVRTSAGSLAKGRNQLVDGFLSSGHDWLLMVDTDHGFRSNLLEILLEQADPQTVPVVSGLNVGIGLDVRDGMGGYKIEPRIVAFQYDGQGYVRALDYPRNTLWRVDGVGTGCLLVHRSVYERIGGDWFTERPDGRGKLLGEDLSFCLRLREAGIPVHIDTRAKLSHHKPIWLTVDDVPLPPVLP